MGHSLLIPTSSSLSMCLITCYVCKFKVTFILPLVEVIFCQATRAWPLRRSQYSPKAPEPSPRETISRAGGRGTTSAGQGFVKFDNYERGF